MARRAMVSGAAGFVGAVLARKLVADGFDTHLVFRAGSDTWRLDGVDAPRHEVDLTDADGVRALVRAVRPEWIFHLAAHGGYPSQSDGARMVDVNVVGTMHLVEAALETGFDAFVNAGSSSEYGPKDHGPRENELCEPDSDYAVTKLAQTLYCRLVARRRDVHIATLRLYSVYGPYEEPTRFVPTLLARGLDGNLPPLVSPNIARDFVYTEDVVEAFLSAARGNDVERGAIYNVGTGRQVTIREAVAVARELFGIAVEPVWSSMPNRAWDSETWLADPGGIFDELGWRSQVSFEAGVRRFADWMRGYRIRYV